MFTNPKVSAAAPRCRSQTCIALNLCPSLSQVCFFKTLGGKEATPLAPVVMLPQVPLSDVQPPASAKPIPWVPLASQASYGITLPPQSLSVLSASGERGALAQSVHLSQSHTMGYVGAHLCCGMVIQTIS